ncbi:MAG: hypothetical protein M3N35_03150, partial [Candidatus Binatota bacterium]|nr:hypothetical protein [Candidatus Binatota bacterium]
WLLPPRTSLQGSGSQMKAASLSGDVRIPPIRSLLVRAGLCSHDPKEKKEWRRSGYSLFDAPR